MADNNLKTPYNFEQTIISCPYKQLRYPALAPVPSPMLGRGVPGGRGEGSYNKSLTGHDITYVWHTVT